MDEDREHLAERLRSPPRSSFLHSAHNTIYHEGVCASLDLLSSRDALEELVGEKGFERRWRRETCGGDGGERDGKNVKPLSSPFPRTRTPVREGHRGVLPPRTPGSARLRRAAGRRASSFRTAYGPMGATPRERPRRPSDLGTMTFLTFFSLLLAALSVVFASAVTYGESEQDEEGNRSKTD